jgi:propanediol dehydratase small subunit
LEKLNANLDYPLYEKHPELIKTQTGKLIEEINMENILSGKVTPADCRISAETLIYQAEIQESFGNPQVGANFRRAAE